ncbi:MAG: hypothetical protein K0R14_2147 [Burkholderiales bacterium]|jgi:hypothetical protein|nr:hypothetical protein [Burkholderiales bacterium]
MKKKSLGFLTLLFGVITHATAFNCPDPGQSVNIFTADDLQAMTECKDTIDRTFVLAKDIDLNGTQFKPMPVFEGIFNGNNKKIINLNHELFKTIDKTAIIKNLTLENIKISLEPVQIGSGALVGSQNDQTLISNVSVTGVMEGEGANIIDNGSLVGIQNDGTIDNCKSSVALTIKSSETRNGGLIGAQRGGTIKNSSSAAIITVEGDHNANYGGLVGIQQIPSDSNAKPIITHCSSTATITMKGRKAAENGGLVGFQAGGLITSSYSKATLNFPDGGLSSGVLVGHSNATIENSYANGVITGAQFDNGGLIGFMGTHSSLSNSYSVSILDNIGGNNGGLVGIAQEGSYTCTNSYWDYESTKLERSAVCNKTGKKNTQEMQTQSTYVDWDFENIWKFSKPGTYPVLAWQATSE